MNGRELRQSNVCKKCGCILFYDEIESYYDESGCGYSTKYTKCPKCGSYHVIEYIEDEALFVNDDVRYFI